MGSGGGTPPLHRARPPGGNRRALKERGRVGAAILGREEPPPSRDGARLVGHRHVTARPLLVIGWPPYT